MDIFSFGHITSLVTLATDGPHHHLLFALASLFNTCLPKQFVDLSLLPLFSLSQSAVSVSHTPDLVLEPQFDQQLCKVLVVAGAHVVHYGTQ